MNIEINEFYTVRTGEDFGQLGGRFPYELVAGYRAGQYVGEGNFVGFRRYIGGLHNTDQHINFDTDGEAIEKVEQWLRTAA